MLKNWAPSIMATCLSCTMILRKVAPKVYMKVITNNEDVGGFHILDMSEGKVYLDVNHTSDLVIHYPNPQLKLR